MSRRSDREPVTILGGGAAGLALAYYLHKAGIPFRLYEASSEFGGFCRTWRSGEFLYDTGAHRFHDKDPGITEEIRCLLGDRLRPVDAPSRIYSDGHWYSFPITPLDLFTSSRFPQALRFLRDLLKEKILLRRDNVVNFAQYAVRRFGESAAKALLMNYSEKLWGFPSDRLSPQVATKRLQGISLLGLFKEWLQPGRTAEHVDGKFLYPLAGFGEITDAMKTTLPATSLFPGHKIQGVRKEGSRIRSLLFIDGHEVTTPGLVVSTLPLPAFASLMGERCGLRFRALRIFFLKLDRTQFTPNASIYFPGSEFLFTRIHEPRNRSSEMAPAGKTSILVEVPCFPEDGTFRMSGENLFGRLVADLGRIGLLRSEEVIDYEEKRLVDAYPVYTVGYEKELSRLEASFSRLENLVLFGRSGTFFYSHLHDQLRLARDFVGALTAEKEVA